MSFPKRMDLFRKWFKAMMEGAIVDKPNYSPAKTRSRGNRRKRRMSKKRFLRRKRKNPEGE